MLHTGLSRPNSLKLFGVKVEGVSITISALEPRLAGRFKKNDEVVLARIVAFADENGTAMLDDDVLLLVKGNGSAGGVPENVKKKHAVSGTSAPTIHAWDVDGRDETMLAVLDTDSYEKMLSPVEEEGDSGGAMAIRGADGRLYMVPGQSDDYRMPDDMAGLVDQLPGGSIELIDMKNIPPQLLGRGSRGRGMRATMTRATMMRATMTRATMMRATMMRATLMRATLMRATRIRATMMRATMVTSGHDDKR